jgi:hypothetical protein
VTTEYTTLMALEKAKGLHMQARRILHTAWHTILIYLPSTPLFFPRPFLALSS